MSDNRDYVVRLRVESGSAKTELQSFIAKGDEAAGSMKRIGKTYEDVQAKTDPVFKALLTQQREVEKATKSAADAVKYYGVSQDQANATIKRTSDHYGQLATRAREGAVAQSMLGKATTGLQAQMTTLASGGGGVAVFLSSLGPWGMAAAAGVGLVSAAFAEAKRTAELLAKEADTLTNASEVTGFSTDKLQALSMEAAKHGVSMEQASTAVVKFTTAWADARDGSGDMLKKLREIDPALATQIQRTKDSATAFELLTQAIRKADTAGDVSTRNALARAAGGKGGVQAFVGLSAGISDAGGFDTLTKGAKEAGRVIGGELLTEIDNIKDELDSTKKTADLLFGVIGAKPILEADLAWQKMRIEIAKTVVELEGAAKTMPVWERLLVKFVGIQTVAQMFPGFTDPSKINVPLPEYPPKLYGLEQPKPLLDNKAQLANLKERVAVLGAVVAIAEAFKIIAENRRATK